MKIVHSALANDRKMCKCRDQKQEERPDQYIHRTVFSMATEWKGVADKAKWVN